MSKLIIFDIDGTLSDTKKVDDKCFMDAFKITFGFDISNQNWESINNVTDWGITEELVLEKTNRLPSENEYQKMINTFISLLEKEYSADKDQFKEVSGANAFFTKLLKSEDYHVGIATGAWEKSALIKIKAVGINPDDLAFSNCNHYKSRENITKHAIEQAKIIYKQCFDEIIYFGDGLWDYKTCKNLGIKFIGIDILGDDKLINSGAELVFQNYNDPEIILMEMNSHEVLE